MTVSPLLSTNFWNGISTSWAYKLNADRNVNRMPRSMAPPRKTLPYDLALFRGNRGGVVHRDGDDPAFAFAADVNQPEVDIVAGVDQFLLVLVILREPVTHCRYERLIRRRILRLL